MATFTPSTIEKNFFLDSIPASKRGKAFSIKDAYGATAAKMYVGDSKVHDANFAFLTTALAKVSTDLAEPKHYVTYADDIPVDVGGGFVDYVEYYSVDWAGIMNEFRNVVGNNTNYIPRVNAGLNQKRVNVYSWEVAYDLRFLELEKMKKLTLQKSIQDIYQNAIVAGWDLFVQKIAYTGIKGSTGLFNNANVSSTTIPNSTSEGGSTVNHDGFKGLDDAVVVAFFNGVFETYLSKSNMNINVLPDTFLVPTYVGSDLSSRFSALYTSTLRKFLIDHNLGSDESDGQVKIRISSRPDLDNLGANNAGRIVAYKRDKSFVRIDMPYPLQHYITLPNIDKMSYTTAFVGQVSEVQLPYNVNSTDLGIVTYWDFATKART